MQSPYDPFSTQSREEMLSERAVLKAKYSDLFDAVSALMFEHDPIEINYDFNADEYDPEAGTVIPRLSSCQTEQDLVVVLHQEFSLWFGPETAGPESNYQELAKAIWALPAARALGAKQGAA